MEAGGSPKSEGVREYVSREVDQLRAVQFTGNNAEEILNFCSEVGRRDDGSIHLKCWNDGSSLLPGDYIGIGKYGEVRVHSKEGMNKRYRKVPRIGDSVEWTGENLQEIKDVFGKDLFGEDQVIQMDVETLHLLGPCSNPVLKIGDVVVVSKECLGSVSSHFKEVIP